jgi:hypothetical protein
VCFKHSGSDAMAPHRAAHPRRPARELWRTTDLVRVYAAVCVAARFSETSRKVVWISTSR